GGLTPPARQKLPARQQVSRISTEHIPSSSPALPVKIAPAPPSLPPWIVHHHYPTAPLGSAESADLPAPGSTAPPRCRGSPRRGYHCRAPRGHPVGSTCSSTHISHTPRPRCAPGRIAGRLRPPGIA